MIERLRRTLDRRRSADADDARIRLEGYPGRGTVLVVRPTGRVDRGRREVELTLDVFIPRLRQFRVELRPWVTDAELARIVPGHAVPVAADHAEPGHVVLAFDMDEIRSIDGLGPIAGGRGGPKPHEGVDPDRPGPDAGR